MRVRTISVLATITIAFIALCGTAALAQGAQRRNNGTFVGIPQASAQAPRPTPFPSSVIIPMGNPVAPMGNPVAPIVPFVRYSDPIPTVVMPEQQSHLRSQGRYRNRNGQDVVYVPVPVPTSYYSYDYYPYPQGPVTAPATIPGQLPGVRYDYDRPVAGQFNAAPNTPAAAPPSSSFAGQPEPAYYSEPRMIVNEPRPNRVVVPPAVGTARADVITSFGQPWGTIQSRGQETLYFDGVTVVFGADGRVVSAR
jgi:hypothetical protein